MLRASSQEPGRGHDAATIDVTAVSALEPTTPGIPFGRELFQLADAVSAGNPERLTAARKALAAKSGRGPGYVTAAIAVAANFQMMNRILDATGLAPNPGLAPVAKELGFCEDAWTRKSTTA